MHSGVVCCRARWWHWGSRVGSLATDIRGEREGRVVSGGERRRHRREEGGREGGKDTAIHVRKYISLVHLTRKGMHL